MFLITLFIADNGWTVFDVFACGPRAVLTSYFLTNILYKNLLFIMRSIIRIQFCFEICVDQTWLYDHFS